MDNLTEPIVCTLSTTEAGGQLLEWGELQGLARSTEGIDGGVAMTFAVELAERIEDLAAREKACCAFLTLTTTRTGEEVRLEITSANPDGLPVIETIAGVVSPR